MCGPLIALIKLSRLLELSLKHHFNAATSLKEYGRETKNSDSDWG
jgi:hypothetical protein